MTTLPELLARVHAAKGPDREIDAAVSAYLKDIPKVDPKNPWGWRKGLDPHTYYLPDGVDGRTTQATFTPPKYTSSLDALAALADRVLPEYNIESGFRRREGSAWAIAWPDDGDRDDDHHAHKAATEPLARLAAILAAKIAMEGT